ncbi:unnamed protein product, partial [Anisakis simplex]|uniref:Uncharacterized protein n=1 Tax=Anisakis simplex TaxID=6269 RepID=A0A0M3JKG0_ANISI
MLEEGTSTSKSTWNQNQGCSKQFCGGLVAGSSDSTTDCFGQSADLDGLGCGSECCGSILGDRTLDSGQYRRRNVTATAVTPGFCGSHKRLAKSDWSCSGNCRQMKQRGCGCSRGSGLVRRIWNSQNHFGL